MSQEQSWCPNPSQPRGTGVPGRPRSCLVQAVGPTPAVLPVQPSGGRGQPQNPPMPAREQVGALDRSPEGSRELHPSTPWPWGWKEVPTSPQRGLRLTLSLSSMGLRVSDPKLGVVLSPLPPCLWQAVITVAVLQNGQPPGSWGLHASLRGDLSTERVPPES